MNWIFVAKAAAMWPVAVFFAVLFCATTDSIIEEDDYEIPTWFKALCVWAFGALAIIFLLGPAIVL